MYPATGSTGGTKVARAIRYAAGMRALQIGWPVMWTMIATIQLTVIVHVPIVKLTILIEPAQCDDEV